jgi:hypothetical protein
MVETRALSHAQLVASRVTDTELWWLTCSHLLLSSCAHSE